MKRYFYSLFFAALLFTSCTEKVIIPQNSLDISGYWINQDLNDTIFSFQRAAALADGQYCFGMLSDGTFIERKNAGWCGTPPIAYADYEGDWSMQDSLIHISVPYWGGIAHYSWKIISIDDEILTYYVVNADYEQTIDP